MIHILIWAGYFTLMVLTFIELRKIRVSSINFSNGVIIGLIYFIGIPFAFILYAQQLTAEGIYAASYEPFLDTGTTLTVYIGWLTILVSHMFIRLKMNTNNHTASSLKIDIVWKLIITIYFSTSLYSAISSGIGSEGSHWHSSTANAFEGSTLFIILKNFSGAFRVMIFGYLIFLVQTGKLSIKKSLIFGAIIVVFDLALTFNRIMLVFYLVMIYILLRRSWLIMTIAIIAITPIAVIASKAWPIFRGIIFQNGFSVEATIQAWNMAIYSSGKQEDSLSSTLNSVFESSNLVVLNFIQNHLGQEVPIFWGYTFLLRPITTFIPSTIWAEKPRVFGTYLGEIINGIDGLALNSTLFGEALANFSYFWPIALLIFIILFTKIYCIIDSRLPGANLMSVFVGIALWRFDSNFASVGAYACGLLIISWILIRTLPKRKKYSDLNKISSNQSI